MAELIHTDFVNSMIEPDVTGEQLASGRYITAEPAVLHDGHHTMSQIYTQRMLYHALFLSTENALRDTDEYYGVDPLAVRSKRHHDGELCFGGGWFIVTITLPPLYGYTPGHTSEVSTPVMQVAQHYEEKYWDLFSFTQEVDRAPEWDGHTPAEGDRRLLSYLLMFNQDVRGAVS